MNITASDREALIKLASSLPQGDETRKAILASLQSKTAGLLSTKARAVRDALEALVDNLEGEGIVEPGDYYTMIRQMHQFLIVLKNGIPEDEDGPSLERDITAVIRLLQAQFS